MTMERAETDFSCSRPVSDFSSPDPDPSRRPGADLDFYPEPIRIRIDPSQDPIRNHIPGLGNGIVRGKVVLEVVILARKALLASMMWSNLMVTGCTEETCSGCSPKFYRMETLLYQ